MTENKSDIADWWSKNPMTYGEEHGQSSYRKGDEVETVAFGSKEFFERADQQLFKWNQPLHNDTGPFGKIFFYDEFRGRPVLEIGCGMGCMSMLWAQRGAQVTSVDLNSISVDKTRRRFELYQLEGCIQQEDANHLSFPGEKFDYVYSWGVLHHSPNIQKSISELFRVLKTGGKFGVMLYHRHSLLHLYHTIYLEGLLHGETRFLDPLALASRYADGGRQEGNPHTWPVTKKEVRQLISPYSQSMSIRVLGTDLDGSFKYMLPGISQFIPKVVKKSWARRWGWSLWIFGRKNN